MRIINRKFASGAGYSSGKQVEQNRGIVNRGKGGANIVKKPFLQIGDKKVNRFAFDLDGTLIDKRFNLNEGVADFFYCVFKNVENPQFIVCTGSPVYRVRAFKALLEQTIQEKYGEKIDFNLLMGAYGGSVVYDIDGKIVKKEFVDFDTFKQIEKVVHDIDKDAAVLINNRKIYYKELDQKLNKNVVVLNGVKLIHKARGKGGFISRAVNEDEYYQMVKDKHAYSLEILSLSHECREKIVEAIKEKVSNVNVFYGSTVQVCTHSKLDAINLLFNDANNLLYAGDGYNDIECMGVSTISFALGKSVDVLTSANYAVKNFNDVCDIVFNGVDFENRSKQNILDAVNEQKKKQEKKELKIEKIEKRQMKKACHENALDNRQK